MCLLDTTDGALMMTLYTTTALARDTVAILYYSIVLTAITVQSIPERSLWSSHVEVGECEGCD